jgi:uncharacterized protein YbaR (Trm112 family)
MLISDKIIEILVCPESQQSLALAPDSVIQELNQKVALRLLHTVNKELVAEELSAGLIRKDGSVIYPIKQGIPVLLIEEGIRL